MIALQPFCESDINGLIDEIPDARFLLQWAGPKYTYPLDAAQLNDTLVKTKGESPSFQVFKAISVNTSESVGHIQLMNIDYHTASCFLGRVLIFQKYRGNGFGKAMIKAAVKVAFDHFNLAEITLGVFDFNTSAINIYKAIGFGEFNRGVRQFQNENWNLIRMKLNKDSWLHKEPKTSCRVYD